MEQFIRTERMLGEEKQKKLLRSTILVFGVGGVGSYTIEALARAGIQHFILVDHDLISISNLNRQLIALHSTLGKHKVVVMKERILDINPSAQVTTFATFCTEENVATFFPKKCDYVIDAIDTVSSKLAIIAMAKEKNIPIISSMGTGNKIYPSLFQIADISETSVCPLAKVMRKEVSKRGLLDVKVLFSKEEPLKPLPSTDDSSKKQSPASISFVPSSAGLLIAGEVIRDIIK